MREVSLHGDLGLQVLQIAEDRGDGQGAAVQPETQEAILGVDIAVDGDLVPVSAWPT